jgi:hypothetical protein
LFQPIKQKEMAFEAIDKKLKEVGLSFTKPTIERIKNKWHVELRVSVDSSKCVNGYIHYRYKEANHDYYSIGHFIASGTNINKLVTVLFEMIKSKEVICRVGNYVDNKVVWEYYIITWDEVGKKFDKNLVDTKITPIFA